MAHVRSLLAKAHWAILESNGNGLSLWQHPVACVLHLGFEDDDNHPSGDIQPSAEDRAVTRALSSAGKVLGVPLHDHLIIGMTGKRFSFAESLPEDLRTS